MESLADLDKAFRKAVQNSDGEAIKRLLTQGANVNSKKFYLVFYYYYYF